MRDDEDTAKRLSTEDLAADEVADALWLLANTRREAIADEPALPDPDAGQDFPTPATEPAPEPAGSPGEATPPRTFPVARPAARQPDAGGDAGPVPVARPGDALNGTSLAKALRPLRKRPLSKRKWSLDEEITAVRAAESGLWVPTLRRLPDRRPEALVVIDESASMAPWTALVAEFHKLLTHAGVFSDVRRVSVDTDRLVDGGDPVRLDRRGRDRTVFVVTDGMGPAWRRRYAARWLNRLGGTDHIAVVNVLPRRLWQEDVRWLRVRAPRRTGDDRRFRVHGSDQAALALPVLGLDPASFQRWVQMLTGDLTGSTHLWVLPLGESADEAEPEPAAFSTPADRVRRFLSVASPEARRLMGLLAAVPVTVPIMHLVRRVMLPDSDLGALAEVLHSGLLHQKETAAGYEFPAGVRAELLAHGMRMDTAEVVRLVAEVPGGHVPAMRELAAVIEAPEAADALAGTDETAPYLDVQLTVLRALAGPYAERAQHLHRLVAQVDTAADASSPQECATTATTSADTVPWVETQPSASMYDVPPRRMGRAPRHDLLLDVRERLAERGGSIVLRGPSGTGKTQLATDYCYLAAPDYDVVWWVPAHDTAAVGTHLAELARERGSAVGERWLVVLDGADAADQLRPLLVGMPYETLITSQDPRWAEHIETIEVGVFSRRESIDRLLHAVPALTPAEADTLAELLGDLPAAVDQVAGWLAESRTAPADCIRVLQSTEDSIPAVLGLMLDHLRGHEARAHSLLELCATLAPQPIPRALFRHTGVAVPADLQVVLRDPLELSRATRVLARLGHVQVNHRDSTVQLTWLTRQAFRNHPPLGAAAVALLRQAIRSAGQDTIPLYLPHLKKVGLHTDAADGRQALLDVVSRLDRAAQVREAELAMANWAARLGEQHPDVIAMAALLAAGHEATGDHDLALALRRNTYASCHELFGAEHEKTLSAGRDLVRSLRATGDLAAARDLCAEILDVSLHTWGVEDPLTLVITEDLVILRSRIGDLTGTGELGRVLSDKRDIFGESHPFTLATASNLAVLLRQTGAAVLARSVNEKTLSLMRTTLGEDHALTLTCATNLASDLAALSEHRAAHDFGAVTAKRAARTLGDNHPVTLTVLANLDLDVRAVNSRADAERARQELIDRCARHLGERHPVTVSVRDGQRAWWEAEYRSSSL